MTDTREPWEQRPDDVYYKLIGWGTGSGDSLVVRVIDDGTKRYTPTIRIEVYNDRSRCDCAGHPHWGNVIEYGSLDELDELNRAVAGAQKAIERWSALAPYKELAEEFIEAGLPASVHNTGGDVFVVTIPVTDGYEADNIFVTPAADVSTELEGYFIGVYSEHVDFEDGALFVVPTVEPDALNAVFNIRRVAELYGNRYDASTGRDDDGVPR